ncbi:MAG TPA: hypothetical protein VFG51_01555 [Candidatus Saccharimonadia bacterium]|nr:hypothetical protein [Candidatus Saccharimonadia bacterium]
MSSTAQSTSLIVSVILSYIWASVPELRPFSLQVVAGLFLFYFLVRHFAEGGIKLNKIMPSTLGYEIAILTSAALILITFTGGIASSFLPLLYFLLFLGVFVLDYSALILLMLLIPSFLWATAGHNLSTHETGTVVSFFVMLPLLLFTKYQYQEAKVQKTSAEKLENIDYDAILFIKTFLRPKLEHIDQLAQHPEENAENIRKQTTLLLEETEEHLHSL